ncbi:MAG: hypothetical protein ACMG6S_17730 [Byssovorax sp.]
MKEPSRSSADLAQATDPLRISLADAQAPTPGSLQKLLKEVLRSDADFDLFCSNHFKEQVYAQLGDGMSRTRKLEILFAHAEPAAILDRLRSDHPALVQKHQHLLEWTSAPLSPLAPRRVALLAIPLLAVIALVVAWSFRQEPIPTLDPFEASAPGIVLGGPWLSTADGKKLCAELKEHDVQHAVQCVAFPLQGTNAAELQEQARRARALVVVLITDTGIARVSPLGGLEKDALLGGTLVMDLASEPNRRRAAIVINALAHLSGPRPDFEPDRVSCPPLAESEPLDRIALLTLFVVPACEAVKIDPRRLQEVCGKATPESDETCALARYLETESSADLTRVRSLLEGLRDHGPARFRSASKLKLARLYCKAREIEKASKEILDLAGGASLCLQAKLAELAACVAVSSGSRPVDPRIRELEELHVESSESFGVCPAPLRAAVLAGRARLRAGAGRWDEAIADYGAAYSLDAKPFYGLYQAESLLHRKRPSEAHALLQRLLGLLGKDRSILSLRVHAALLDWIASRQQSDQGLRREADGALLSLHAMLSPGEPALEGPLDEELRSLACDDARAAPCIYDVLRRPSSKEALLQSLGGG